MIKVLDSNGVLHLWSKVKSYVAQWVTAEQKASWTGKQDALSNPAYSSQGSAPVTKNNGAIALSTDGGVLINSIVDSKSDGLAHAGDDMLLTASAMLNELDSRTWVSKVKSHATSEANINLEVNTVHRIGFSVDTLQLTLPTISDTAHAYTILVHLKTGASPAITFASGTNQPVLYFSGYDIAANTDYELNCMFDGAKWVVARAAFITA